MIFRKKYLSGKIVLRFAGGESILSLSVTRFCMCFVRNCNVLTKNVVGMSTCIFCTCVVFFGNQTAGPVKVLRLVNLINCTKPNESSFACPQLLSAGEYDNNSGGVCMTFVNNINEIEEYNIPQN